MENEKRLIDANALLQSEVKLCRCIPTIGSGYSNETSFKLILDEAPTVDAVEVVRCKDCKQWNCVKKLIGYDKLLGYCLNDEEPIERWEHDFCSYGERKDGA